MSDDTACADTDNRLETLTPDNPPAELAASEREALVAYYKLQIAKLRREQYGQSAERGRRLLDQLELQLEEAAASAAEDEIAAAPTGSTTVHPSTRRKPMRAPFPAHLPRERVVIPAPSACPCCGGKLAKLGETITETLEVVPRQWKVIQTVREKFTCRACEKITQPPAPFHVIPRGHVGPSLLAMILYAKYGEHQPLNRQSQACAREGVDLDVEPAPGAGVVSGEISEELGGCLVIEASQAGAIVVGDEGVEVGVALGVIEETAVVGGAVLRHAVEVFAKASVEALGHAVGLRPEGPGEAVIDAMPGTAAVERMLARGFVVGLALLVDGEAVGELGAVVGQDGVDLERKLSRKRVRKPAAVTARRSGRISR